MRHMTLQFTHIICWAMRLLLFSWYNWVFRMVESSENSSDRVFCPKLSVTLAVRARCLICTGDCAHWNVVIGFIFDCLRNDCWNTARCTQACFLVWIWTSNLLNILVTRNRSLRFRVQSSHIQVGNLTERQNDLKPVSCNPILWYSDMWCSFPGWSPTSYYVIRSYYPLLSRLRVSASRQTGDFLLFYSSHQATGCRAQ